MSRFREEQRAVIFAGGPGSGKSHYARIFANEHWKIANPDPLFEQFLWAIGVDPRSLPHLSAGDFYLLTEAPDSPRKIAKRLMKQRVARWEREGKNIVYDGTGDEYHKVEKRKQRLEDLGYEVDMVFIYTPLEQALRQNRQRSRVLPDAMVKDMWHKVQENLPYYRELFGPDYFHYIQNVALQSGANSRPHR